MADKDKKKDKEKEKEKEKDKGKDKEEKKEKKKDKEKDKTEVDMTTRTGVKDKSKILVGGDLPESVMGDDLLQSPIARNEKRCVHHLQPLTLYCESCEEPICDRCRVTGPHNNQMHRITLIEQAYQARVVAMHQVITGSLLAKRDQLVAQVHRIDHRLEEIKHVKGFIERDVRSEYGGILERLRSAEGVKLAVLQHEIATLQRDIDKINDVVNVVNELTSEKEHIDFLLRCRHLTDTIEFAVAKPFKTTIEVVPYDLPRELAQQRKKIEKMNIVPDILEMKDQLIYEMVNRLSLEEEKVSAEMNKAAQEEINEWSKLTDRFAGELRKYHIICHYCGIAMDTKNINQVCQANNTPEVHSGFGFTIDRPDKGWHGTRRHFFAKPKSELVKAGRIATLEARNTDYLRRNEVDQSVHRSQYHMFLEVLLAKIRKHCADKDIHIDKLFAEYDKKETGVLNHVAFTFLLNEFCGIDLIEIDKLKDILDPQNRNQIQYAEFVRMVNDPQYLAQ